MSIHSPPMSEDTLFCERCGRKLSPQDKFCPECGMMVANDTSSGDALFMEEAFQRMESRLNLASFMMLIYAIPLLFVGIYILIDSATIADTLFSIYQEYAGVTESELDQYVKWVGYTCLASGVMGTVSAALCYKRCAFWAALFTCILSTFTGVFGFLALMLGMISFWLILSGKPVFDKHKVQPIENKEE